MNRDERYDRAPESPPRRIPGDRGRPAWIAPFDGGSGGTWIGVNDHGVAACLLNGYAPAESDLIRRPDVPSRGTIVPRILEEQRGPGPAGLSGPMDFSAYPSFTLVVVSTDGGEVIRWRSGCPIERETVDPGWLLLTSSSWSEPLVADWRQRAFASWRASGERLEHGVPTLHTLAPIGEESLSAFMTREHSGTRSISQVRIHAEAGSAVLSWWPRPGRGPVDLAAPGASLALPLARA